MIKTTRLVLKELEDTNQEDVIDLLYNETIKKTYMIPDFSTYDEAVAMFQYLQASTKSINHIAFGIYKNDTLIGWINDVDLLEDSVELGYVIHPTFQHRGYASEALKAVIQEIFNRGYQRVIAGAFASNTASFRVMEACGMKRIHKEEDIAYLGQTHHCFYYGIEKTSID